MNLPKTAAANGLSQQSAQDASPDFSALDRRDPSEEIIRRHVDQLQSTSYRSAVLLQELGNAATQAEAMSLCMQYATCHLGQAIQYSFFLQDVAVASTGHSASSGSWY